MHKSWIAATGMMVTGMAALAGCSDSATAGTDSTDSGQAVSLASSADVLRELGNLGSGLELELAGLGISQSTTATPTATRLLAPLAPRAATPVNAACSGGGSDTRTSDSKSRTFSYFSFSGPVSYQSDIFSNCVDSSDGSTETINGSAESGQDGSADMLYAVLGTGSDSVHLASTSDGASIDRGLLGIVEARETDSTNADIRGVLQATGNIVSSNETLTWQLALGQGATPYEITITQDGLSFSGPYSYTGSASGCGGGDVMVTTPTPLNINNNDTGTLTTGVLTLSSGGKSVTVTIGQDGSATLSGNVSGTLSKDQVNGALLGSPCVPLNTVGG